MKKDAPRYELKVRNNAYKKENDVKSMKKTKLSNKLTNSAIACAVILLVVMIMKMSSSSYAGSALKRLDELIKKQMDFSQTAKSVSEVFSQTVGSFFTDNNQKASADSLKLGLPIKNAKLTKKFETGKHPVYQTDTPPTGIELSGELGSFIYAPAKATVTQITKHDDAKISVSLILSDNISVVFDNLASVYFKQGESVEDNQILGVLSENESLLFMSLIIDSEYVDPMQYLDSSLITQ